MPIEDVKASINAASEEMVRLILTDPEPRSRDGQRIFELAEVILELCRDFYGAEPSGRNAELMRLIEAMYGERLRWAKERGYFRPRTT